MMPRRTRIHTCPDVFHWLLLHSVCMLPFVYLPAGTQPPSPPLTGSLFTPVFVAVNITVSFPANPAWLQAWYCWFEPPLLPVPCVFFLPLYHCMVGFGLVCCPGRHATATWFVALFYFTVPPPPWFGWFSGFAFLITLTHPDINCTGICCQRLRFYQDGSSTDWDWWFTTLFALLPRHRLPGVVVVGLRWLVGDLDVGPFAVLAGVCIAAGYRFCIWTTCHLPPGDHHHRRVSYPFTTLAILRCKSAPPAPPLPPVPGVLFAVWTLHLTRLITFCGCCYFCMNLRLVRFPSYYYFYFSGAIVPLLPAHLPRTFTLFGLDLHHYCV